MSHLASLHDLISYLGADRRTIHYTGWVGYKNLGDEILLEAARECFAPAKVAYLRDFGNPLVKKLIDGKRHRIAMLGGGTQIGVPSPIERFKGALARSDAGIVFGAGVTPAVTGPIPEWLEAWGQVLRPLRYVGVRGTESAATLQRVGVNAQVLGDPVCWFSQPTTFWKPQPSLIGFNVGHSHGHMYGQENVIQTQLASLARELVAKGNRLEFFCVWPEDLATTKKVAADAGIDEPVIHEVYEGAAKFQRAVSRMQVFVGIKLHAVALAMCSSVPSLMIEYRPKCREFATTMGVEKYCVRSDSLDVSQLLGLVDELQASGSTVSEVMYRHAQVIRERLLQLSRTIVGEFSLA